MATTDLDMKINTEVFRKNFPIIIAVNRHQATLLPMRVEYRAADYYAGQVMAKRTSTGLFAAYAGVGGPDGTGTAVSVLFEDISNQVASAAPSGSNVARGIFAGKVWKGKLIGLDANAITNLNARTLSDSSNLGDILSF